MTGKREPVAELGDEDYRIVRHTHDVDRAWHLMRARMLAEDGCPLFGLPEGCDLERAYTPGCPHGRDPGIGHKVWVRIVPALPNSWAAGEGLHYTFNPAKPGSRGAFPAVEFR